MRTKYEQLAAEYVEAVVATNAVYGHYQGWEGFLVWQVMFNVSRKTRRLMQESQQLSEIPY